MNEQQLERGNVIRARRFEIEGALKELENYSSPYMSERDVMLSRYDGDYSKTITLTPEQVLFVQTELTRLLEQEDENLVTEFNNL